MYCDIVWRSQLPDNGCKDILETGLGSFCSVPLFIQFWGGVGETPKWTKGVQGWMVPIALCDS